MIRARAHGENGATHIVLGITRENVARLMKGMPIRVTGVSVGVPEISSVLIIYGENEAVIAEDMREAGLIGPHTIMRDDR